MKGEPVPAPIAPEGIAQVFADAECREYANGAVNIVYVRINGGPFEFGDELIMGSGQNQLRITTPKPDYPDDPYGVVAYTEFIWDSDGPIQPGTIAECVSASPTPVDVTGLRTIWYGDE